MNSFLALLKLEILTKLTQKNKSKNVGLTILKSFGNVALIGVIALVIYLIFSNLISMFVDAGLSTQILIYYIFAVQILQIVFGMGKIIKTLYNQADYGKILHLPIKASTIFLAKTFYLFLSDLFFSVMLTLPFLICFGLETGQGASFYTMILPALIFIPLIPFLISMLFAIPFANLATFLRNKFVVTLLIYVIGVGIGFYVYTVLLKNLVTFFEADSLSSILSSTVLYNLKSFANVLYPQILIKNLLLNNKLVSSLLICLCLMFIAIWILVWFSRHRYANVIKQQTEQQQSCFCAVKPIKERGAGAALFYKELRLIFRSPNYSFQYLTIALTTPLMVYFSNVIACNVGVSKLGTALLPGVSILVLVLFLSMATSFSASTITREGNKFFYTKLYPVSFRKQILIKFLVYFMVATPSVILSCFVLYFAGFLTLVETAVVMIGVALVQVGNISTSILIDVKKPKFEAVGENELTEGNSNINKSLSIGFIIAFVMGVGSIFLAFLCSVSAMYFVIIGFAIPYATIQTIVLFTGLNKKYSKIEC